MRDLEKKSISEVCEFIATTFFKERMYCPLLRKHNNTSRNHHVQQVTSEESMDHLLFECPIAVFMWVVVRDALNWSSNPQSVMDFQDFFLNGLGVGKTRVMWFLFWAISSPSVIVFKMLSFFSTGWLPTQERIGGFWKG
jgi:hypothetical protein